MLLLYGVVASYEPFRVAINIRPYGLFTGSITSAASPEPDIQTPDPAPFGEVQYALVCVNVLALYARIHPCHGPLSPWAANPMYRIPFNNSMPGRWFSHFGSQFSTPPELPFPVPETLPANATGPPNFSCPVVISSACNLCINVVSDTVDFATTYIVFVVV